MICASSSHRDHLYTYLAQHARHGPPDLRIAAEAELAADLWRASCPRPWQGLCVDFTWATNDSPCSLGRAPLFTVRPRDPALRREALRHATAAARLSRTLDLARVAPWRRPALRAALGQAALITSDDAAETLIALEFPRHLAFNVEYYKNTPDIPKWQKEFREQLRRYRDSVRRFNHYWTAYTTRTNLANRRVDALRTTGSAPAMLLGMTRLALALGEVMDEQDFITTDDLQPSSARPCGASPASAPRPGSTSPTPSSRPAASSPVSAARTPTSPSASTALAASPAPRTRSPNSSAPPDRSAADPELFGPA